MIALEETPPRRLSRYRSLDFWRGTACLLVIVFHSTFYVATRQNEALVSSSGIDGFLAAITARFWLGVPMFFVISGYCIAASADSSRRNGRPAGEYFYRRFRRIFPPYWICLIASAILAGVLDLLVPGLYTDDNHPIMRPWSLPPQNWIGNLTLTETWIFRFFGGRSEFFLGHAWTLSYEEQFYAVVGAALLVCPRYLFFALAAITTGVLTLSLIRPETGYGFFFDGRWLMFAAGLLLYYEIMYATRSQVWVARALYVLGIIWACHLPEKLLEFKDNPEQERLVAFSFALLLSLIHPADQRIHDSRLLRPIGLCGLMCYSLYLVHWPIVKGISHAAFLLGITSIWSTLLLVVPACLAASLLVGWLFHITVERRFLNSSTPSA